VGDGVEGVRCVEMRRFYRRKLRICCIYRLFSGLKVPRMVREMQIHHDVVPDERQLLADSCRN
jgi:hypothetical protein